MHTASPRPTAPATPDDGKAGGGAKTGNKFLDFLLSIFGSGGKVKSHNMAIMGGDGPGANLVFYDRKLEDIWNKRKEQGSKEGKETVKQSISRRPTLLRSPTGLLSFPSSISL